MPIYPVTCDAPECRHQSEQFARVDDRLKLRCPACGGATLIDFGRIRVSAGENTPAGRGEVSVTESVSLKHRDRLRRLMPKSGHLVGDDGKVRFRTTQDAKKWFAEREENTKKAIKRRGKDPDQVFAERRKDAAQNTPVG